MFKLTALILAAACTSSATQTPTLSPSSSGLLRPTTSPVEFSNLTVYNNGATHLIDESTSLQHESYVVTQDTTILLKEGGTITAPSNSEYPAIRLSVSSTLNATGGSVTGSFGAEGGEAVQLNNGKSSPKTASFAEFYNAQLIGGDASVGVGGDALVVNGFGTEAVIYGGEFVGGTGVTSDGFSVRVMNSALVHIHGGTFLGGMMVEGGSVISLHGCFSTSNNETQVSGLFADETEINVAVKKEGSGYIDFVSVPGQECDTAPSVAPTSFPTLSSQPTVAQKNGETKLITSTFMIVLCLINLMESFN